MAVVSQITWENTWEMPMCLVAVAVIYSCHVLLEALAVAVASAVAETFLVAALIDLKIQLWLIFYVFCYYTILLVELLINR